MNVSTNILDRDVGQILVVLRFAQQRSEHIVDQSGQLIDDPRRQIA